MKKITILLTMLMVALYGVRWYQEPYKKPSPSGVVRMDVMAAAPTPTNEPNADAIFIIGIVSAIPEIANAPTPWPMKMLSIILNSEVETIAIIAGMA